MLMISDNMHVDRIVERWRQRQDMMRARLRLELQGQAMCRRLCDGDKVQAAKLWASATKDDEHEIRPLIEPLLTAMVPLLDSQKWIEKDIKASVRQMRLWNEWAVDIKGFGEVSFGGVIGECAIMPGEYRNPSCLWKRMGMAVIGGERQRKCANAEKAIEHGYNPTRRSLMWNIGGTLMKAQIRNPKGEDGKPIGESVAIGELGQVYLDRKVYENTREGVTPILAHLRAKRYMEKRLLRQMWQASRV